MFGFALTSIAAGIFDLKHYVNLQLVPHISKHHQVGCSQQYRTHSNTDNEARPYLHPQYWRLLVHSLVCGSSSDLLLTELLLFNVGIPIERAFGGVKYAVSIRP